MISSNHECPITVVVYSFVTPNQSTTRADTSGNGLSPLPRVLCPTKQKYHRLKIPTTARYVSLMENVILGAFAYLRISTINFVMSAHSHRITGSHKTDCHEIRSFEYFYKICRENLRLIKIR